jgi:dihydrofolate reductase
MSISLIVAVAQNSVIGYQGKMPWHLPAELQYFKRITMGQPIIMGRKTFDSIGRALPGRRNIVVTRDASWQHADVDVVHSVKDAFNLVQDVDAFVIGGATLYNETLSQARKIYLTKIDATLPGDTFFPELAETTWLEISREHRAKDAKNIYDIDFIVYERR